jgi:hypothetical protein
MGRWRLNMPPSPEQCGVVEGEKLRECSFADAGEEKCMLTACEVEESADLRLNVRAVPP